MSVASFVLLSSGLFLGWALGANDAANIFGTAVGTRMVRFKTAAIICSFFICLGAVISGVGTAHTLGNLGPINALGGAFVTALAAGISVYSMIKIGLPVSVSQAIVGAIIGWNYFTDSVTDMTSVAKIAGTWVACPLLSAVIASIIYVIGNFFHKKNKIHLLKRDTFIRTAMILTGAFGAYALGANNMANVVGVFVPVSPFIDIHFGNLMIDPVQQLFFVGSIAACVGVFTYSHKVMGTVGKGLMRLTPFAAWVVVLAQSLVLFIFASEGLEHFLAIHNLPTIPLVPVSSTQAVVGAIIGIGLIKGAAKDIKWSIACRIAGGWVITPVIAAIVCFFALFFMQNVFNQRIFHQKTYQITDKVFTRLSEAGYSSNKLTLTKGKSFTSSVELIETLEERLGDLTSAQEQQILGIAEIVHLYIDPEKVDALDSALFTEKQIEAIKTLSGKKFSYLWDLQESLVAIDPDWAYRPKTILNKRHNKEVAHHMRLLETLFVVQDIPQRPSHVR